MTWNQATGGNVSSILRSEYEQLNTPNRAEMLTEPIVTLLNPQTSQGTVAVASDRTVFAGVDPGAIQQSRWW